MRVRAIRAPARALAAGLLVASLVVAISTEARAAAVINVPADHATIQAAIDAASNGDTVLVAPGTYTESIDFGGKAITVESSGGPSVTTIDGGYLANTVLFVNSEGRDSVIRGFTITGGKTVAPNYQGGGVRASGGGPTIEGNVIVGNRGCGSGDGVSLYFSSALVKDNLITANTQGGGCIGGSNGGLYVGGNSAAEVIGNVITGNASGGLTLFAAGPATVTGNLIIANSGVGLASYNVHQGSMTNNIIADNGASQVEGGGLFMNNTIVGTGAGAEVRLEGSGPFTNNIVYGGGSGAAVKCETATVIPFTNNDVYHEDSGTLYAGYCTDQTGTNGNVSLDPHFHDPGGGDYHLYFDSPVIDLGTATGAPTDDFDGDARPVDGDGVGGAQIDIGADEYVPVTVGVSGTVTYGGGTPLGSVCVTAYDGAAVVGESTTAANGVYRLATAPGTYTVYFEECSPTVFGAEWYDDAADQGSADSVIVVAATVTSGVDAGLAVALLCDGEELTMWGTHGPDVIEGTSGPDVIAALDGDDVVDGKGGADRICGGDGDDELRGGGGGDRLFGGDGDDELRGGGGDDRLVGGDDDDLLFGEDGSDELHGGNGDDTVSYQAAAGPIEASLLDGVAIGEGSDTLDGVENLIGSPLDDILVGDEGPNHLEGRNGHDILASGGDADTIIGGAGDDLILPGPGDDDVDGQAGFNTVSFAAALGPVTASLSKGVSTGEGSDSFDNIRNLIGSLFDDELTGDGYENTLVGGDGADTIVGGGADDVIDAGAGADTVDGGPGKDLILGGDGPDILQGGNGNDEILGGAGPDIIDGGEGKDDISGGGGRDQLSGGPDDDLILGGGGKDKLLGGDGDDELDGGGGNDTLKGEGGEDYLFGGKKHDKLLGGDAFDFLEGGPGDDVLKGGKGVDVAIYANATKGVTVDLAAGTATGEGQDTLSSIKSVGGSEFGDVLIGTSGFNGLIGLGGADTIFGGSGGDNVIGDGGNDTLHGEGGDDFIDGGPGSDLLYGGPGYDLCLDGEQRYSCEEVQFRSRAAERARPTGLDLLRIMKAFLSSPVPATETE